LNSNLIVFFQYGSIGDSPKKAFVNSKRNNDNDDNDASFGVENGSYVVTNAV